MEKRIRSLEIYIESKASYKVFLNSWKTKFGTEACLNRKSVHRLLQKFRQTGNLENRKRKGYRSIRTNDTITDISSYFELNSGMSTRRFFELESYDMSLSSLRRILKEDLNLKPYKARVFQHLNDHDFQQRYDMCSMFLRMIKNDPFILSHILWTDECFMKLNDTVNHHNIRYWSKENPHYFTGKTLNASGVMVFAGISTYGCVGPYFFDELQVNSQGGRKKNKNSVNGESYSELLSTKVIPELNRLFPNELLSNLIFQLDGAPGHKAMKVIRLLNENFPGRWWGNKGPLHWAPRSPDLSPLGIFYFG